MWNVNPDSWDYRHGYNAGVKKTLEALKQYQDKNLPPDYLDKISEDLIKKMWYTEYSARA